MNPKKVFEPTPPVNLMDCMLERFASNPQPIFVESGIYKKRFIHDRHRHDFPQVWYCLKGRYTHTVDDVDYDCGAGSVITVPPGTYHGFDTEDDDETVLICIEGTFWFFDGLEEPKYTNLIANMFLAAFSDDLGADIKLCRILYGAERAEFERILLNLCRKNYRRQIGDRSFVKQQIGCLFQLPSFALSSSAYQCAKSFIKYKFSPVMDAVLYINKNFSEKITSEEVVSMSTLCRTDFFRLIKKALGVTFSSYLQQLRIRHVQFFITFSTYSFPYISDRCGFGNVTYMNRIFKKYYQRTPSEERSIRNYMLKQHPSVLISRERLERVNLE